MRPAVQRQWVQAAAGGLLLPIAYSLGSGAKSPGPIFIISPATYTSRSGSSPASRDKRAIHERQGTHSHCFSFQQPPGGTATPQPIAAIRGLGPAATKPSHRCRQRGSYPLAPSRLRRARANRGGCLAPWSGSGCRCACACRSGAQSRAADAGCCHTGGRRTLKQHDARAKTSASQSAALGWEASYARPSLTQGAQKNAACMRGQSLAWARQWEACISRRKCQTAASQKLRHRCQPQCRGIATAAAPPLSRCPAGGRVGQRGSLPPSEPLAKTSLTCGRAGVREDVGIALLQRVGGEAPVALSAACAAGRGGVQRQLSVSDQSKAATCACKLCASPRGSLCPTASLPAWHYLSPGALPAASIPSSAPRANGRTSHSTQGRGPTLSRDRTASTPYGPSPSQPGQVPVSWFSRKVTERDGHQPSSPAGLPAASRRRQYSHRSNTACMMPLVVMSAAEAGRVRSALRAGWEGCRGKSSECPVVVRYVSVTPHQWPCTAAHQPMATEAALAYHPAVHKAGGYVCV